MSFYKFPSPGGGIPSPDDFLTDSMTNLNKKVRLDELGQKDQSRSDIEINDALEKPRGSVHDANPRLQGNPGSSSLSSGSLANTCSTFSVSTSPTPRPDEFASKSSGSYCPIPDTSSAEIHELSSIVDLKKREKVLTLRLIYPSQSVSSAFEILAGCDFNIETAANFLIDGDYPAIINDNPAFSEQANAEPDDTMRTFIGTNTDGRISEYPDPSPATANDDIEIIWSQRSSEDRNIQELASMYPDATIDRCREILHACDTMKDAEKMLAKDFARYLSDNTSPELSSSRRLVDRQGNAIRIVTEDAIAKACSEKRTAQFQEPRPLKKPRGEEAEESYEGEEEVRPAKKARTLDPERAAADLEPAVEWVITHFGDVEGVKIILDSGEHPCQFTKKLLCEKFKFFRDHFSSGEETIDNNAPVRFPDISRETFDGTLQWSVCKKVQLEVSQFPTHSTKISALLDVVLFSITIGLPGPGWALALAMKELLIEQQDALKPAHIRTAYTLREDHPIRKLFVQAAVRPYLEHREDDHSRIGPDYDDSEDEAIDNARRNASGHKFVFDKEKKNIHRFAFDLYDNADKVWRKRDSVRTGKRRGITSFTNRVTCPLTGDRFTI